MDPRNPTASSTNRRRPRTARQMEEIVVRLASVSSSALEACLAAANDGLEVLDRGAGDLPAYMAYYTGLERYLNTRGGGGAELKHLGAAEVGAAFAAGRQAVEDAMYELGWIHE